MPATGFDSVSSDAAFSGVYEAAAKYGLADQNSSEPLRLLDIGGGSGQFGRHVLNRSPDAQYFNIDFDDRQISFSPGIKINGNFVAVYDATRHHGPFDTVACLNFAPALEHSEKYPMILQRIKPRTYEILLDQLMNICVLSSGLLLKPNGYFLLSRIGSAIPPAAQIAGLRLEAEYNPLMSECVRKLVIHDTGGANGIVIPSIDFASGAVVSRGCEGLDSTGLVEFYTREYRLQVFRHEDVDVLFLESFLRDRIEGHKATLDFYTNPHCDDSDWDF